MANPTRFSSLKGKECNKSEETLERCSEEEVRSKPDPVDRPKRSARAIVHHYNGTQYCSTETVLLISGLEKNLGFLEFF